MAHNNLLHILWLSRAEEMTRPTTLIWHLCVYLLLPNRTLLIGTITTHMLKKFTLHFFFFFFLTQVAAVLGEIWDCFIFLRKIYFYSYVQVSKWWSLSLFLFLPQCQCVPYFGFLMTGQIPAQLCRLRGSARRPHQDADEGRSLFGRTGMQLVQQARALVWSAGNNCFCKKYIKSL